MLMFVVQALRSRSRLNLFPAARNLCRACPELEELREMGDAFERSDGKPTCAQIVPGQLSSVPPPLSRTRAHFSYKSSIDPFLAVLGLSNSGEHLSS